MGWKESISLVWDFKGSLGSLLSDSLASIFGGKSSIGVIKDIASKIDKKNKAKTIFDVVQVLVDLKRKDKAAFDKLFVHLQEFAHTYKNSPAQKQYEIRKNINESIRSKK